MYPVRSDNSSAGRVMRLRVVPDSTHDNAMLVGRVGSFIDNLGFVSDAAIRLFAFRPFEEIRKFVVAIQKDGRWYDYLTDTDYAVDITEVEIASLS